MYRNSRISDYRKDAPQLKSGRAIDGWLAETSHQRRRAGCQLVRRFLPLWGLAMLGALALGTVVVDAFATDAEGATTRTSLSLPSRSTTIALTSDDQRLVVVNRETHSVSIIKVRNLLGRDSAVKLAEVAVGQDPRCVAISPDDSEAYVTNALSGSVSVIALAGSLRYSVVAEIPVAPELRGCALSPTGAFLFIVSHTAGNLYVIDTAARTLANAVLPLSGNPTAIAVTNNGDDNDLDETVFVTQFFAELIPGGPGEGFDTGRQGFVHAFSLASGPLPRIKLSPLSNVGFTADRTNFCPQTAPTPPHSNIFCPNLTAPKGSDVIVKDPQGCFPNQLAAALIRGNRLWVPNICAGPEPPVQFRVNVQGAVHVVNTDALAEVATEHVNLNAQIATEPQPADPRASLGRIFLNDLVDMDATADGQVFLLVSRGANYVMRATRDQAGKLTIGAPDNVIRWQTGNIPNGVVISYDGRRAYVNNEVSVSVTAIDLEQNVVIEQDIPSGEPPAPGTFDHAVLVGKLAFFTALGIPDNNILGTPIRDFNALAHRGKQSDNGWSTCASCHPDGLSDNVTWIFPAGPRQTLSLDGLFAKDNSLDQKLVLWSALRGSNTDFNNNSRGVQGGCGFASDDFAASLDECLAKGSVTPANPNIYDHGIVQGGSDALDVQSLWVQTVRTLHQPQPAEANVLEPGRVVFETNCASCHGGPKWTKSQIFHRDNPAFDQPFNPANPVAKPLDPGVTIKGPQFVSFTLDGQTINYLEKVGTFNSANPLEIRANGITAFGAEGFVPPPLLGIRYTAPYLHHGQAQTLADVFAQHDLIGGKIATKLSSQQQQDLLLFLNTIDGRTPTFRSQADDFRDALGIP